MSPHPITKFLRALREAGPSFHADVADVGYTIVDMLEDLDECESPIEQDFFIASSAIAFFFHQTIQRDGLWIEIHPQTWVTDSDRADFLLSFQNDHASLAELIVECDGHDYHEKTKEQARKDKSRDRRLLALGYQTIRFTGSEIFRDAPACAAEALRLLFHIAGQQKRRTQDGNIGRHPSPGGC